MKKAKNQVIEDKEVVLGRPGGEAREKKDVKNEG